LFPQDPERTLAALKRLIKGWKSLWDKRKLSPRDLMGIAGGQWITDDEEENGYSVNDERWESDGQGVGEEGGKAGAGFYRERLRERGERERSKGREGDRGLNVDEYILLLREKRIVPNSVTVDAALAAFHEVC
jgi:hypothetical protein